MMRKTDGISAKSDSKYTIRNGIGYFGEAVKIDLEGLQQEYVDRAVVVKDGKELISPVTTGTVTIDTDGEYKVRVYDITGKYTDYSLSSLVQGMPNSFKLDTTAPELFGTAFTGARENVEGVGYVYTTDGEIIVSFTDSGSGVNTSSFTADDVSYSTENGSIRIDTKSLHDGTNVVSYSVKDNVGNTLSGNLSLFMMRKTDGISGISHSDVAVSYTHLTLPTICSV